VSFIYLIYLYDIFVEKKVAMKATVASKGLSYEYIYFLVQQCISPFVFLILQNIDSVLTHLK